MSITYVVYETWKIINNILQFIFIHVLDSDDGMDDHDRQTH